MVKVQYYIKLCTVVARQEPGCAFLLAHTRAVGSFPKIGAESKQKDAKRETDWDSLVSTVWKPTRTLPLRELDFVGSITVQ